MHGNFSHELRLFQWAFNTSATAVTGTVTREFGARELLQSGRATYQQRECFLKIGKMEISGLRSAPRSKRVKAYRLSPLRIGLPFSNLSFQA